MATSKKQVAKSAPVGRPKLEPVTLKLENNVPIPPRGIRDPHFVNEVSSLLNSIKPKQSFVVPKEKLHAVKRLIKTDYQSFVVKSALIKPDDKFARVWRVR